MNHRKLDVVVSRMGEAPRLSPPSPVSSSPLLQETLSQSLTGQSREASPAGCAARVSLKAAGCPRGIVLKRAHVGPHSGCNLRRQRPPRINSLEPEHAVRGGPTGRQHLFCDRRMRLGPPCNRRVEGRGEGRTRPSLDLGVVLHSRTDHPHLLPQRQDDGLLRGRPRTTVAAGSAGEGAMNEGHSASQPFRGAGARTFSPEAKLNSSASFTDFCERRQGGAVSGLCRTSQRPSERWLRCRVPSPAPDPRSRTST